MIQEEIKYNLHYDDVRGNLCGRHTQRQLVDFKEMERQVRKSKYRYRERKYKYNVMKFA